MLISLGGVICYMDLLLNAAYWIRGRSGVIFTPSET